MVWKVVLAFAFFALAAVECGISKRPQPDTGGPSWSFAGADALAERPLRLPEVKLAGSFGSKVPGECLSGHETVAGAIHLRGVPGEGALGPSTQIRSSPAYARISGGTPRITYWSAMGPVPGSDARVGRAYWITRDIYQGPMLIRGDRIDRPGELGFAEGRAPSAHLRLPPGRGDPWDALGDSLPDGWRAAEVPIRVSSPGCYAIQLDGDGFQYVATFAVADG